MYKAEGADREKYTIAVYDEGWHIYTLTYTRRREWEGVIYTTDRNAPERIKIALMKAARGTPYEEHVKNWQPILGKGEGSYRIHIGEWARDILAKNLKNHKK